MTAAHRLGNAWWGDPSTEVVPEATEAQTKAPDEMAVEDGESPLALLMAGAACEGSVEDAGCLPSCHSLMPGEWGSKCSFDRIVQKWVGVWRT